MAPFKSKAQAAKFAVLEKDGKLPAGTHSKWMGETKNFAGLPTRSSDRKGTKRKGAGRVHYPR